MGKRSKQEIVRDILISTENKLNISQLMRKANLSSVMVYTYINILKKKRYLKEYKITSKPRDYNRRLYQRTDNGFQLLLRLKKINI